MRANTLNLIVQQRPAPPRLDDDDSAGLEILSFLSSVR